MHSVHRGKALFLWWELLRSENLSHKIGRNTDEIGCNRLRVQTFTVMMVFVDRLILSIPEIRKRSLSLPVKVNPFFPAGTEHHHPGGDISARSYKRYLHLFCNLIRHCSPFDSSLNRGMSEVSDDVSD
jgi:hypothetical protein